MDSHVTCVRLTCERRLAGGGRRNDGVGESPDMETDDGVTAIGGETHVGGSGEHVDGVCSGMCVLMCGGPLPLDAGF